MQKVQLYKTSDGEFFENEAEAAYHEQKLATDKAAAAFRDALIAAGYGTAQVAAYARGAVLMAAHQAGEPIPAPRKRKR